MTKKVMRLLVPAKQLRPQFGAKSLSASIFHFAGSPLGAVQALQNSSALQQIPINFIKYLRENMRNLDSFAFTAID
jgi:hypothetical protein